MKLALQKSMLFTPLLPSAGPTGGLGLAWPAPTISFTIWSFAIALRAMVDPADGCRCSQLSVCSHTVRPPGDVRRVKQHGLMAVGRVSASSVQLEVFSQRGGSAGTGGGRTGATRRRKRARASANSSARDVILDGLLAGLLCFFKPAYIAVLSWQRASSPRDAARPRCLRRSSASRILRSGVLEWAKRRRIKLGPPPIQHISSPISIPLDFPPEIHRTTTHRNHELAEADVRVLLASFLQAR